MPEWSIGAVSKTVVRLGGPGVRIPLSPQHNKKPRDQRGFLFGTSRIKLACIRDVNK